jgi:cysteine desulfurase family protein
MIYLDNAATSWPKPPEVFQAMASFMETAGGNPGRAGHRLSIAAGRIVYQVRESLADFLNLNDPLRVVFTSNATHAINLALNGVLRPGDRVLTSSMEHNAVMRPLRYLQRQGVELDIVACAPDGQLDLDDLRRALAKRTRLVVMTHASNVCGTIMPIAEIAKIAHASGSLMLLDAAQSAGLIPIDVTGDGIDLLAFTGHKGLLGPTGTGGLVIGPWVDCKTILPLVRGGTGSASEFEEQPEMLPDKFESGTLNAIGIAGLGAGVRWVMDRKIENIRAHEVALIRNLVEGLQDVPGVKILGPFESSSRTAVVSFTIAGQSVSDVGLRLDEEYGILSRVGLHCAPAAHRTLGAFPGGTVRLAPGVFSTLDEMEFAVAAVKEIALKQAASVVGR